MKRYRINRDTKPYGGRILEVVREDEHQVIGRVRVTTTMLDSRERAYLPRELKLIKD